MSIKLTLLIAISFELMCVGRIFACWTSLSGQNILVFIEKIMKETPLPQSALLCTLVQAEELRSNITGNCSTATSFSSALQYLNLCCIIRNLNFHFKCHSIWPLFFRYLILGRMSSCNGWSGIGSGGPRKWCSTHPWRWLSRWSTKGHSV